MNRKIPELLAPAGGMRQLTAAVENGADAVYLGGPAFNARINADNFTEEEMKAGIRYAHLRNVKVYVTLNILLRDEELLTALQYAKRLYEMGADGLILQDLGLADLVRRYIPGLPIHLSTQGSVYNLSGVKKAFRLGFSRVVLARELSLAEIGRITAGTSCEIEVFIHGALCMCYSGQCQLSRALGGGARSGNRGLCAQPCRLPYKDDRGRVSYALSPKDLCGLDYLGELAEAGVASLKIEGRMKSAEYVAAVVGIYRKYLDLYASQGTYQVSDEDRMTLAQVFNRGGFTDGYLRGNPGRKLLSGSLSKHQGVYIGNVIRAVPGTELVDVKLSEKLELGDGVEIRSGKLIGNVITYIERGKNGALRIGDLKGKVAPGDPVYRITDAALMKRLRKSFEEGGPEGSKHKKTVPVDMELEVAVGKPPLLTVSEGSLKVSVRLKEAAERAVNKPLTEETAEKQLRKTGGTPFSVSRILMSIEKNAALPVSALNQLRRQALSAFEEEKLRRKVTEKICLPEKLCFPKEPGEKRLAFYFYSRGAFETWDFQSAGGAGQVRAYVPLLYYMREKPEREGVEIVPYILNISKGQLDHYIENSFDEVVQAVKRCGIAIGNLSWIDEFVAAGVTVYADYGLNLANRQAAAAAASWNIQPAALSHEVTNLDMGAVPLMITEHPIETASLRDRKKQDYEIVRNFEKDKFLIFKKTKEYNFQQLWKRWETADKEVRVYIP